MLGISLESSLKFIYNQTLDEKDLLEEENREFPIVGYGVLTENIIKSRKLLMLRFIQYVLRCIHYC